MAKAKPSTTVKKTTKKAAAKSKAAKASTTKAKKTKKASKKKATPQEIELMNETGRRKVDVAPAVERRKRRRQIDPTTCEREYTDAEVQFMHAMDEYKRASGRMFPTCSEILEVLNKLGYRQIESPAEMMYEPNTSTEQKSEEDKWNEDMDEDR